MSGSLANTVFIHSFIPVLLFCDPVDCSPPRSSVHGFPQARTLQWVAILFSRGSFWPRDRTRVSCIGLWILHCWATRETFSMCVSIYVYIHVCNGRSLSHKNNEILPFATTCMDLVDIMLGRKVRQRKVNAIYYHLYVDSEKWNRWRNTTKQKQTHRYGEQTTSGEVATSGEGQDNGRVLTSTNYIYKINQLQEYIVQHREFS